MSISAAFLIRAMTILRRAGVSQMFFQFRSEATCGCTLMVQSARIRLSAAHVYLSSLMGITRMVYLRTLSDGGLLVAREALRSDVSKV